MPLNFTKENPRLFSYIVTSDTGLAPNPFWGKLTLAVCKPQIRSSAHEGDIIVGLTPRPQGYLLTYAMVVSETLTFSEYFRDPRFSLKKPNMHAEDWRHHVGDNLYKPKGTEYVQLFSLHSQTDGTENEEKKNRDLSGRFVLIGNEHYYFGANAKKLPTELDFLHVGRGHRCSFSANQLMKFDRFLDSIEPGVWGKPRNMIR